jgi:hypothetical protein
LGIFDERDNRVDVVVVVVNETCDSLYPYCVEVVAVVDLSCPNLPVHRGRTFLHVYGNKVMVNVF